MKLNDDCMTVGNLSLVRTVQNVLKLLTGIVNCYVLWSTHITTYVV